MPKMKTKIFDPSSGLTGVSLFTYRANRGDNKEHVELQAIHHHGNKLPVFSYLKQLKR